jgi:hypothetical protein
MTRRTILVALAALAIVAIIIAMLIRAGVASESRTAAPAPSGPGAAANGAAANGSASSPSPKAPAPRISLSSASANSSAKALPAVGRPLVEIRKELEEMVRAGDARAACRLGYEIDRCANLPTERMAPDFWRSNLEKSAPGTPQYDGLRRMLDYSQASLAVAESTCAGFEVPEGTPAWDYTLAAALAGNRQAIWNAVFFPMGLDFSRPENTLEGWTQWRQYAPGLITAGIQAGDPRVFSIASRDYYMPSFGAQLFDRDPVRSAALLMAILPSAAPAYRPTMERDIAFLVDYLKLSPQDQEAARALAATLPRVNIPSGDSFDWSHGMNPKPTGKECEDP